MSDTTTGLRSASVENPSGGGEGSSPRVDTYAVVRRAARPSVTTTKTVTMATMQEIADAIPVLIRWLSAHDLAPAGPPFLRYLVIDRMGELVVQAGVPVETPVEGDDDVEPDVLPEGDYLTTVHRGPYDGLIDATAALLDRAERSGLRLDQHPSDAGDVWAARLEWYETDPAREPDPTRHLTRLELKLG